MSDIFGWDGKYFDVRIAEAVDYDINKDPVKIAWVDIKSPEVIKKANEMWNKIEPLLNEILEK